MSEIRLQVRLARAGLASRRKCEEFISAGRVSVNGKTIIQPGSKVQADDEVRLDGRLVRNEERMVYIALHKPTGFLCADEDRDGRSLAKSLLEVAVKERIFHVGRLDYMTSGLILYTNDGSFSRSLSHPSGKVEKEYVVTARNVIPQDLLDRFKAGISVDGVRYRAVKAELISERTAQIVLAEGRNREIRRVFQSAMVKIKRVHRVRIGSLKLGSLASGRFRYLNNSEVTSLLSISTRGKGK